MKRMKIVIIYTIILLCICVLLASILEMEHVLSVDISYHIGIVTGMLLMIILRM